MNGVWGGAPTGSGASGGLGAGPPATLLRRSRPGWALGLKPGLSKAERSEAAGPEPTQLNWIQTNLATKRRDQTVGLIES